MKTLKHFAWPYLFWMSVTIIVPMLLILVIAFSDLNVFRLGPFTLSLEGLQVLRSEVILTAMRNSIRFAFLATVLCFFIGYPVAYLLARSTSKNKTLFVTFLILPVWSNMLLRIVAWERLFFPNSILNMFGISLDLIGTDTAIIIGMISMYLPFMIFPIYSVLDRMDHALIEAAIDLGASRFKTFFKVTLPLSFGGVVSGVIMTLLPAMTAFALPARLGGGRTLLIGNVIEDYFMRTANFNAGSLVSLVMMLLMIMLYLMILRFDKEGETLI